MFVFYNRMRNPADQKSVREHKQTTASSKTQLQCDA